MTDEIHSYRVRCPTCGEFGQLRAGTSAAGPVVISFSCRNQTERTHSEPSHHDLLVLVGTSVGQRIDQP